MELDKGQAKDPDMESSIIEISRKVEVRNLNAWPCDFLLLRPVPTVIISGKVQLVSAGKGYSGLVLRRTHYSMWYLKP